MKTKSNIKAGGFYNHNQAGLKTSTKVRAGGGGYWSGRNSN